MLEWERDKIYFKGSVNSYWTKYDLYLKCYYENLYTEVGKQSNELPMPANYI